jgi:hypothetical protein
MPDEIVFEVKDATATRAIPIGLDEAGLRERDHLQEWVVSNPEVLGDGVMIVAIEFGTWVSHSGSSERDRLDVLALDSSGRLVVVELKRGPAPDMVDMQAIKYAAMASRFDPDQLAAAHSAFLMTRGEIVSESDALERLRSHSGYQMDGETLRTPKIILMASAFPPSVTATAVWLSEMGVDVSLVQFQAYRAGERVLLSVSTLYPVRDVEEFTVAPTRTGRKAAAQPELPEVPWTDDDYRELAEVTTNPTALAALELCSQAPATWVALRDIEARAGRTPPQARGDLAFLTKFVKSRFLRSNWPFQVQWAAGGPGQAYYSMTAEQAEMWIRWGGAQQSEHSVDT